MQLHSLVSTRLVPVLLLSLVMTACGGSGGGGNGGFLPIVPEPTTIAPIIPPSPTDPALTCTS